MQRYAPMYQDWLADTEDPDDTECRPTGKNPEGVRSFRQICNAQLGFSKISTSKICRHFTARYHLLDTFAEILRKSDWLVISSGKVENALFIQFYSLSRLQPEIHEIQFLTSKQFSESWIYMLRYCILLFEI